MSQNVTKTEIRLLLSSIQQFLLKMPQQKAQSQATQLQKIVKKYDPEIPAHLQNFHKDLQFKFNFLKLAYPSLAKQIQQESLDAIEKTQEMQRLQQLEKDSIQDQEQRDQMQLQEDSQYMQKLGLIGNEDIQNFVLQHKKFKEVEEEEKKMALKDLEEKAEEEIQGEQVQDGKRFKTGTYVMKDGKLVEGEAPIRETVDFSNWYAGNVDPEDLKRHKELLDRQHFGGPVWEGKKPNPSILQELALGVTDWDLQKGEVNPNLKKEKEEWFEEVKR